MTGTKNAMSYSVFEPVYMTIWQCRSWLRSAWSRWFGLVWHFIHEFL